jgi:hypothetical protein
MRYLGIILAMMLLASCASDFHQPKVNGLGYLPVANDAEVEIAVNQGIDTNQFRRLLYVQTEMHGTAEWYAYQDYIMTAFREMDFFDEVVTRRPTVHINTTPPTPTVFTARGKTWFDVTDKTPMRVLRQEYGHNFMVAKATLRDISAKFNDDGAFFFELKLIESRTGKVVFQASKEGKRKLGIDYSVINPVLNYARGYLLYYDPTFIPTAGYRRSLAEWAESFTYDPTPNIGWDL